MRVSILWLMGYRLHYATNQMTTKKTPIILCHLQHSEERVKDKRVQKTLILIYIKFLFVFRRGQDLSKQKWFHSGVIASMELDATTFKQIQPDKIFNKWNSRSILYKYRILINPVSEASYY